MPDPDDDFPGERQPNGSYLVNLDELEDLHIFQARVPGFKPEEGVPVPPEPINKDTALDPADVVLFFDKGSPFPVEDGVNQQGYVVNDKEALFLNRSVRSITLDELRDQPNAQVLRVFHPTLAPYIATTLLGFAKNPLWFGFASNFLKCSNFTPFVTGQFFPDDTVYQSDEDYESAWEAFVNQLQPGDLILTFDRRSIISKIIAKVTHGPFSHIAHYMGDGQIWEVVTSGTQIVPLDAYKGRHYRVACYRHSPGHLVPLDEAIADWKRTAGTPGYNYFAAIRAGIRTYFGDKHHTPGSPNGIILAGPLTFIVQV